MLLQQPQLRDDINCIPNDILADVLGPFNLNMVEENQDQSMIINDPMISEQQEIPIILQNNQDIMETAMMELIRDEESPSGRQRNFSSDYSDEGIGLSPPMLQVSLSHLAYLNFLFIKRPFYILINN